MKRMIGFTVVLTVFFIGCAGVGPAVVDGVSIDYDGSTIYTPSVDLDVTVSWVSGSTSTDTLTVNAPDTYTGEVTETYTVGNVSDSVTVNFSDRRLIGEWTGNDGSWYIFNNDGTYDSFPDGTGNWKTQSDSDSDDNPEIHGIGSGWHNYIFNSEINPTSFELSSYTYTKN